MGSGRHWSGRPDRIGWHDGAPFPRAPGQHIWRRDQANQAAARLGGRVAKYRAAGVQNITSPRAPLLDTGCRSHAAAISFVCCGSWNGRREGERNSILFWAGCRLFEADNSPAAEVVTELLRRAAVVMGVPDSESLPTIASAR